MKLILDLPGAIFSGQDQGNGNELCFDEKGPAPDDPLKIRLGSWNPDGYFAVISGDLLTGDPANPTRHEQSFIGIRRDDHPESNGRACFEFYCEDKLLARLGWRAGLELFVPLKQGYPPPANTPPGVQLGTADGRYIVADQTDGNLVVYDQGVPVWDRWSYEASKK